jgi:antitoxin MazE
MYIQMEHTMTTTIQRWGNSQGIRIPQAFLKQLHISVGDTVDFALGENEIIIRPMRRNKHTLSELLKNLPKNLKAQEYDWGKPVGREEW